MRTTVTLDDDTAAAVDHLRQERNIGVSAAVNTLLRAGLTRSPEPKPFVQRTSEGHARIDLTDVAEAQELLDGPQAR